MAVERIFHLLIETHRGPPESLDAARAKPRLFAEQRGLPPRRNGEQLRLEGRASNETGAPRIRTPWRVVSSRAPTLDLRVNYAFHGARDFSRHQPPMPLARRCSSCSMASLAFSAAGQALTITPRIFVSSFSIFRLALGTFDFGANFFDTFDKALLVLKGGSGTNIVPNNYVGYLLVAGVDDTSGTWLSPFLNTNSGNLTDVSHLSF
jgi:hypothetical protein